MFHHAPVLVLVLVLGIGIGIGQYYWVLGALLGIVLTPVHTDEFMAGCERRGNGEDQAKTRVEQSRMVCGSQKRGWSRAEHGAAERERSRGYKNQV